jgi:hypothetical protein
MTRILAPLAAVLLPLGVSYGAFAMVENDGTAHGAKLTKLPACEIHVEHEAGSVVLEGKVAAARASSGSYQLKIWQNGAGSSSISQDGDFTVPAGGSSSLGLVSLPRGGSYGATLKVTFDNDPVPCKATTHGPLPITAK